MSDPKDLPLAWFSKLQFAKLSSPKNVAKRHWLEMTIGDLFLHLSDEVDELEHAIEAPCFSEDKITNPAAIIDECLDVANFAAMIAHWVATRNPDVVEAPKQ